MSSRFEMKNGATEPVSRSTIPSDLRSSVEQSRRPSGNAEISCSGLLVATGKPSLDEPPELEITMPIPCSSKGWFGVITRSVIPQTAAMRPSGRGVGLPNAWPVLLYLS